MFGLPSSTSCDDFKTHRKLQAGYNPEVIDEAVELYKDGPVIDASDEARALRYLQAMKTEQDEIVLVGKSFSPDIEKWEEEKVHIPKKNESEGDKDDFSALRRLVSKVIDDDGLASKVSIHNFSSLGCSTRHPLIYMMWPTPNKGYGGRHLLKIWEKVREDCATREKPLKLVGHSTDSAGFSLSALVTLMTPTEATVKEGIMYLGLCIPDERFVAPYFWSLPSIAYSDFDHLRRTLLRNLKYDTRDLTMYKDGNGTMVATINHLHELMEICLQQGEAIPFLAQDLVLINFFDQRPDTANRIFSLKVAEMLESHVRGSQATCLYIIAAYHLTEPFYNVEFGTPEQIQMSVSTGITIFRLWRRYLELKKMRLHALPNASKIKEKRGHFLTYGAYTTAELIFSAASLHCLAMFLHFKDLGPSLCSPNRSGTISTEKIIGQLQGKTTNIQTLDTSPTFGDMLNRSKDLQFITEAINDLSTYEGVRIPSTSNRKTSHFRSTSNPQPTNYQYPDSYQEFLKKQQDMHKRGVKRAQELINKFLPEDFSTLLESHGVWDLPYSFKKPTGIKMVSVGPPPKEYNKLHVSLSSSADSAAVISNTEEENATDIDDVQVEEEEQPKGSTTDSKDSDPSSHTSVSDVEDSESDQDDHNSDTGKSVPPNMRWYIKKDGNNVHISKALKVLLPREYISKERSRRHWVGKSLIQAWSKIDKSHDVIRFRDVAVRVKDQVEFLHILSIQSEEGKEQISANSKNKGSVRGRPYTEVSQGKYDVPYKILLSKWIPLNKVLCEIEMVKNEDGTSSLSEDSIAKLQLKEKDNLKIASTADTNTDDDYYEVEKVLEVRLNKQFHSEEYKVRFKGYTSDDDMWLPSSAFKEPVTFHTISKRGRLRKHRMKEGSSAPETQGNNPRKTPTETNLKRKYVHELKTGNTNNHFIQLYSFINRYNRNWSR